MDNIILLAIAASLCWLIPAVNNILTAGDRHLNKRYVQLTIVIGVFFVMALLEWVNG